MNTTPFQNIPKEELIEGAENIDFDTVIIYKNKVYTLDICNDEINENFNKFITQEVIDKRQNVWLCGESKHKNEIKALKKTWEEVRKAKKEDKKKKVFKIINDNKNIEHKKQRRMFFLKIWFHFLWKLAIDKKQIRNHKLFNEIFKKNEAEQIGLTLIFHDDNNSSIYFKKKFEEWTKTQKKNKWLSFFGLFDGNLCFVNSENGQFFFLPDNFKTTIRPLVTKFHKTFETLSELIAYKHTQRKTTQKVIVFLSSSSNSINSINIKKVEKEIDKKNEYVIKKLRTIFKNFVFAHLEPPLICTTDEMFETDEQIFERSWVNVQFLDTLLSYDNSKLQRQEVETIQLFNSIQYVISFINKLLREGILAEQIYLVGEKWDGSLITTHCAVLFKSKLGGVFSFDGMFLKNIFANFKNIMTLNSFFPNIMKVTTSSLVKKSKKEKTPITLIINNDKKKTGMMCREKEWINRAESIDNSDNFKETLEKLGHKVDIKAKGQKYTNQTFDTDLLCKLLKKESFERKETDHIAKNQKTTEICFFCVLFCFPLFISLIFIFFFFSKIIEKKQIKTNNNDKSW